jgi:hypothetical protein
MNKKKYMRMVALGLLLITGSNFVTRFFYPLSDFALGGLNGVGIGLAILGLFYMRNSPASKKA